MVSDAAFLGRNLENLSQLIELQSREVFEQAKISVPIKSCSTFMVIGESSCVSSAEVARRIGASHQLVKQKIITLEKRDLISIEPSEDDRRKQVLMLTPKGKRQYLKLLKLLPKIEEIYQTIYQRLGFKLDDKIELFRKELIDKPLSERGNLKLKI